MTDSPSSFYTQNIPVYTETSPPGPIETPVSPTISKSPSSFYGGSGVPYAGVETIQASYEDMLAAQAASEASASASAASAAAAAASAASAAGAADAEIAAKAVRYDVAQALSGAQQTVARTNLGLAVVAATGNYADLLGKPVLASVATSGAYADLTGKPTLGTAAALNVGVAASNVVQLNGSAQLPAVSGALLTSFTAAQITTALGYSPASRAGDTFSGTVSAPLFSVTGASGAYDISDRSGNGHFSALYRNSDVSYLWHSDISNSVWGASSSQLIIYPATPSTTSTTGALVIAGGGIGCAGNINLGGYLGVANSGNVSYVRRGGAVASGINCALDIGFEGGATSFGMAFRPTADATYPHYFMNAAGTNVGSIYTSNVGTTFNTTSDARLKTDPQTFDGSVIVAALKPYDFAWKSTSGRAHGVYAQEAAAVYPEAVNYDANADQYSVDYSKFVPVLIRALQQAQDRITVLEAKLNGN